MSKQSISEIRTLFGSAETAELLELILMYAGDERQGVRQIIEKAKRQIEAEAKEDERIENMLIYERKYAEDGIIAGIDEAGRGPLAGPVVAAAVILAPDDPIRYVNDSKQLSEKKREQLYDEIMKRAVSVGVGIESPETIDRINILQADYSAMRKAVAKLDPAPQILLNDAVTIPDMTQHQVPIIRGDSKSLSIAAASIIAKVTRDRLMREYDVLYPEYGFAKHKGYGSAAHIEAIRKFGPSPIHRISFIGHFV